MVSFTKFSLLLSTFAVVAVSAAPSLTERDDWKYSVGWDGVTLSSDAIGTPIASPNATALDVSVCTTLVMYQSIYLQLAQKRTVGGVYICEDIGWGGRCGYAVQAINTCISLGSDWNKQISSFGPDPCTGCQGSTYVPAFVYR